MALLLILATIIFAVLSWRNLYQGIFFLFLLLPTYLLRFQIGPLPSTFLEVMIWVLLLVWLIKHKEKLRDYAKIIWKEYRTLCIATGVFLLAATISLTTAIDLRAAAGEWKAFYIEPVLLGLMLLCELRKKPAKLPLAHTIMFALILCGLAVSVLAIYQHFTGWMVPHAFWANNNSFRVTAWYGFPNGVGLFLATLFPIALLLAKTYWQHHRYDAIAKISTLFIPLSLLAIWYAKSTGGIVGVAAAIGLLLLFHHTCRRPTIVLAIAGLTALLLIPMENPIKQELLLQDRSGQIRISMWEDTWNLLKDQPIQGAGLASYDERIEPYHTRVNGEGIEIFHHPHNLFLTIWVNTGILGLAGFLAVIIAAISMVLPHLKNQQTQLLLATLVVILVTGLVDSPYIKNDLSVLFWAVLALLITPPITPKTTG